MDIGVNNPNEARNMLLQNPQLAYALLQAQVVMRIIDPATAVTMLHPIHQVPPVLLPGEKPPPIVASLANMGNMTQAPPLLSTPQAPPQTIPQQFPGVGVQDVDLRSLEPPRAIIPDNRHIPQQRLPLSMDQDMRSLPPPIIPPPENLPRNESEPKETFNRDPRAPMGVAFPGDPRQRPSDPRQAPKPSVAPIPSPQTNVHRPPITGIPTGASDQEKAALIMQVLQLSDDQIAMLPPEQRTSILVLKEQIAKSTQR